MINTDAVKRIAGSENVRVNEDMGCHTTFRAGGKAALYITPGPENIVELVKYFNSEKADYYIVGNGSNLLVKDSGYDGAVLHIGKQFEECSVEGLDIKAGAGAKLSKIAALAYREGLEGFEFASGIPGTFGGAVTMNAGAYGGEMSQVLKCVQVIDKSGNILNLKNDELNLGYRHSIVMEKDYLVLGGVISLKKGQISEIKKLMEDYACRRKEKQPLEYPSAGSTFKRPEGHFAGKLIMDSGLAGKSVGGAQVSEKHCGFIINKGGATATDILKLIEIVSDTVYQKFGVKLEPEVKILG